ncbi:ATP-dependent nuclease [Oecophyllibacter saccharovorans]|uniref:ATP-dependent nuclease n=1 Tax=Oecophyllibacter saccharovorans TaxID=2558360 RepID=UPI00116DF30E|nr:AAA family ATPase [Oecophyllibacter saccharovorans]TPW36594.1 ATP-binding protein [Oecophyllibacter saccharovorans]
MLIEEVKLRFGAGPEAEPLVLDAPAVTIFVGPNNSGKSMVLREIAAFCHTGNTSGVILDELKFRKRSDEEIDKGLEAWPKNRRTSEAIYGPNQMSIHFMDTRAPLPASDYRHSLKNPDGNAAVFAQYYATFHVLILDGPSRIDLTKAQDRGDLQNPKTTFAKLLMNDPRRQSLREVLFDAFGLYLGLDMAEEGASIHLRYGNTFPPNEHLLEGDTLEWMSNARPIRQWSDGMKAFTGMLLALRAGDPKIMIIDEPEAFLHPTLAYKLGREIAKTANQGDKQVFVSTHSSQFLMGAIQSGAKVNIVRLTYQPANATARMLSNDDIRTMMQEPFLRSANALSGIFYDGVVVTEADADRAFYQELNERLLAKDPKRGAPNTLFLNANGKDSVRKIIEPLRKLGIPVAAILDIDALNGNATFAPLLEAINYPHPHHSIKSDRDHVWSSLIADDKKPKSEGGLALLSGAEKEKAENLFDLLDRYGLFVLRNGEVENWLRKKVKVPRSKKGWLYNIFEALGSDPKDPAYVHPSGNDVWAFLDKVGAWIKNKDRRGIPSAQPSKTDPPPPQP